MQAMVLNTVSAIETSPLRMEEVPEPSPGAGEVRIKVRCCGVCRTDLHIIEGELPPPRLPLVVGHQTVGVVDRVGSDCHRLKVGDRIGIAWLRHTCGQCRFCTSRRENLCEFSRYSGYHADGGYGQYANVPEDFTYFIENPLDDAHVAPLL